MEFVFKHLCLWDLVVASLGLFVFSCIHNRIAHNGPMPWPVLGVLPSLFMNINGIHEWLTTTLIKSGGTFCFRGVWKGGSHGIVTVVPENIEYILKQNFNNFPKGKYYTERFSDLLGDGIFNVDADVWKEQRLMAKTEMHSSRFMAHSLQTIQDLVHEKLLKLAEKLANSEESFDLQEILLRYTFDNICTAAFGVDPGSLGLDLPHIPFAKAFEDATELTLFRFMVPPFVWKPMKFLRLGYEKKLKESIKIVHDFADETVKNRRRKLNKFGHLNDHSDLLSRLMQIGNEQKRKAEKDFPDKFFRDFCVSFIIAGRDTTSVALAWFFWLLHENPEVEHKVLEEINEILTKRNPTKTKLETDVVFTIEELKNMVYLHAALSESLRLYPSVPIEMKQALEDAVFPDGSRVKKGARIHYSIISMGRIESIWGKDCLEFKPERWIKEGRFVSENQFKYAVFNAGPRLCIGKKFAYMQMKMVAASILLRYSIKVVEGHHVVPKVTTTLYMKNGLMVTLHPRLVHTT